MFRNWMIVGLILSCSTVLGQDASREKHLQRWVDDQTIAVGIIDVRRIDMAAAMEKMTKLIGPGMPQPVETRASMVAMREGLLKAGAEHIFLVYGNAELGGMPTVIVPLKDKSKAEEIATLVADGRSAPFKGNASPLGWNTTPVVRNVSWKVIDEYVVIGTSTAFTAKESLKPTARQQLVAAMQSKSEAAVQVYLIPSNDIRKVLSEMMPLLPKELGGGSSNVITQGLQWAAIAVDLPPSLSGTLKIQTENRAQAQELTELWKKMLEVIKAEASRTGREHPAGKLINEVAKSLEIKVSDRTIEMMATSEKLEPLTELLAKSLSDNTGDTLNASQLRNMLTAMHNFHGDFNRLPTQAICDKDGKPLLSWRVAMLPYLGQDHLYKQFKLDEPWDSENNIKLIEKMPRIYVHPVAKNVPANHTLYQVFYSKKGDKPAAAIMENGKITLQQFALQDGTSNTFVLTDAASTAVPWTKPADLYYDGKVENLPKLVSPRGDDWAHVVFADGSVRRYKVTANPKLLWQLIGRNDGYNMDAAEVFGGK